MAADYRNTGHGSTRHGNAARPSRRAAGFTLIELMLVVAIVGIIASIGIPSFLRFQLRAKTSEAKANLQAIRTAHEAHRAEFGAYISASASPGTNGGTKPQGFVDTGGVGARFDTIGWRPEGLVYFNYALSAAGGAYTADASADINGNGVDQVWAYVRADIAGATTPGALGCIGVWDPVAATPTVTNAVGPCGPSFGQSEF